MGGIPETFDDSVHSARGRASPKEDQLVVVLECDRPAAGGARYSLEGVQEVRIGRGLRREATRTTDHGFTTLHLTLPGRSLSSAHARMVRSQGQWIVEDAGSKNGTMVNGARVTRGVFEETDILELGRTLLILRRAMDLGAMPSSLDASALDAEPVGMRTLLPSLAESFATLKQIAASSVPMLLLGETGTGKEVLAEALHALSLRSGALVAVNCGALSSTLQDAQLFGHTRGAFSGAVRDEVGFVRAADGGTLFLDEIGELPPASQALLLRVIQKAEVVPVGTTKAVKVDLRVISATLRAIEPSVEASGFRSDLYARLAGMTFRLPRLAERIEDLGLLVADLLRALAPDRAERLALAPELGRALLSYAWPLNIRELKQGLQTGLVLSKDDILGPLGFPQIRTRAAQAEAAPPAEAMDDEDARLRIAIIARLREHGGNVAAVARAMNKAPMQIHRWMRRFAIEPDEFRGR